MGPKFLFVETLPRDASTRDRELQASATRGHAAGVAHSRKKLEKAPRSQISSSEFIPHWRPINIEGSVRQRDNEDEWEDITEYVSHEIGVPIQQPSLGSPTIESRTQRSSHRSSLVAPRAYKAHMDRDARRLLGSGRTKEIIRVNILRTPGGWTNDDVPNDFQSTKDKDKIRRVREMYRGLSPLARNVNQIEPFYCNPEGNTSSFYRGCEYFLQVIIPNNAPVYTVFNVSNVFTQYTFDLTEKDHFLHVFLGTMHLLRSSIAPETSSSQDAWRHCGVALSRLRQALTVRKHSRDDDHLIGSVLFLALLARAYGDYAGYEVHKRNLAHLVRNRGGLNNLGYNGLLKACILQWDSFWDVDGANSVFLEERDTLTPSFPDLPISPTLAKEISDLPSGFESLARMGLLPFDLIEILRRINHHHTPPIRKRLSQDVVPIWHKNKHVDFWEACSSLAIPGPDFNKFLCLTLLLYTANEFSPIRRGVKGMTLYSNPRTLLTEQIHLLQPLSTEPTRRQCWMWMWMVLIDSWSEKGDLTPTGQALLDQLLQHFPEIRTWAHLDNGLKRFFYSEKFRTACRSHWESARAVEQ